MVSRRGFAGLSASSLALGALGLRAAPRSDADPSEDPSGDPPLSRCGSYRGLRTWLATMSRPGFAGTAGLGVVTDSTGSDTSAGDGPGWITQLGQALAVEYPWLSIRSRMWDQAKCAYADPATLQVGTEGLCSAAFGQAPNGYLYLPCNGRKVTSDLSIRIKLSTTAARPARSMHLLSMWGSSGAVGDEAFDLFITATNRAQLRWTPDGVTQVAVSAKQRFALTDNVPLWLRCDLDVDDGAGNNVVKFSTRTLDTDPWTSLGTVTTPGTTSIQYPLGADDGSIPYILGGFQSSALAGSLFIGNIYEVDLRGGLGENAPSLLPRLPAQWRCAIGGNAQLLTGGPTLEIVGGAWGGHGIRDFVNTSHNGDGRWTGNDPAASFGQDNSSLLVPDYGQLLTILGTSHNDADLQNADILAYWDLWLAQLRSRLPLSAFAVTTENPALPAFGSYRVSAQRMPIVSAWAARNALTLVDTFQAFLEHSEWTEDPGGTLINALGVHPTTYGHAQVPVPVQLAAIRSGA